MDDFQRRLQDALDSSYTLERELGGGGMSRVFVAVERALGRRVVVKVLSPELAAGVNADRFRREIQLAAQLHHPHIVPLLSAGEVGELLYYTMPYIEGESLRSALRSRGRLSVRDVVRVLDDVVDALAYAHARGVVHRDIKPDNLLMHGAHALVTDFGVAKAISAALPLAGHTTTGMAIGTPAYMAPEQLAADPAADHRMDLYAIGLVAYELLTGGSPYSATSPAELLAAQLTRTPPPLHEVRPDVPAELSAMIMGCLAKDPAQRPASAEVLLAQLGAITTPQGAIVPGAGAVTTPMPAASASGATTPAARATMGTAGTGASASSSVAGAGASPGARARRTLGIAAGVGVALLAGALLVRAAMRDRGATVVTVAPAPAASAASDTGDVAPDDTAIAPIAAPSGGARTAPLVLTRAESLAIAEAVRQRIAEEQRAASAASGRTAVTPTTPPSAQVGGVAAVAPAAVPSRAFADSLRSAIQRAYSDSIQRAVEELRRLRSQDARIDPRAFETRERGGRPGAATFEAVPMLPPPPRGTRRIVVSVPIAEGRRTPLGIGTRVVADTLRAHLARHPGWEVVGDSVVRRLPTNASPIVVGFTTRADVVLTPIVSGTRDSVSVTLHIIDPRTRSARVIERPPVTVERLAELAAGLAQDAERLIAADERTPRAPREP